jgi:histidinol-phosphate aminotransferase
MIKDIVQQREALHTILLSLPVVQKIYQSDANFLLVKVINAKEIYDYLLGQGIVVRDRSRVTLCEGCLRITVGTPYENETLVESLKTYVETVA